MIAALLLMASLFGWFALHTIVPAIMLLSTVAIGGWLVYRGTKENGSFHGVPVKIAFVAMGLIVLLYGLTLYQPTAQFTLSLAGSGSSSVSSGQLFSVLNTETQSTIWQTPDWIKAILVIAGLTVLQRKKRW